MRRDRNIRSVRPGASGNYLSSSSSDINMTRRYLFATLVRFFVIASLCLISYPNINAQDETNAGTTLPEASEEPNAIQKIVDSSDGNVEILIDDDLVTKILTPPTSHKKSSAGNSRPALRPGLNRMSGYRIQVFSDGRSQGTLESRARARGNAITAKFPKYRGQVYTFSSAPNWYTRVGNFQSASEANEALAELRRSFPSFADEMRIVKCQIVVIK